MKKKIEPSKIRHSSLSASLVSMNVACRGAQVMAIKSRAVLPYLVPVLTSGAADTRALSALAAAAGGALARHLPRVLPALLAALRAARHTPHEARELDHCRNALLPVADPQGVRWSVPAL